MSTRTSSPSVGGTLAGGIQDVAAILPLIGTEQCEKHVGSALTGGYLYAAAAPLSIFGSLGIVKAGIAILISSISISLPHISISFHDSTPSIKYLGQQNWLGAEMLKDAGFELTGVVSPLIGMDGHCFKAETRLMEMLEEQHVNDPEKISVHWKTRQWNIMLIISTILGAAFSLTPYIALLLGPASWRPTSIHIPWLFPVLRIIGSCTATITCQFIIQSRVISIMKNRILFMTIQRQLKDTYKAGFGTWLKDSKLRWDTNLPAEQCIWSLNQYLSFKDYKRPANSVIQVQEGTAYPPQNSAQGSHDHIFIPISTPPKENTYTISDLHQLQREQFPTPTFDSAFTTMLWILLVLSLPLTVAGYIGCFTLVSSTPTPGNGPLVWVGLEAALSILRIFIWASNPSFDEETGVTLQLKLSEQQPASVFTVNDYDPDLTNLTIEEGQVFTLMPENEFLEAITPFRGPLDYFRKNNHLTIYFTISYGYRMGSGPVDDIFNKRDEIYMESPAYGRLFMTVFDFNTQTGVTLASYKSSFYYFVVIVKYDTTSRKLLAKVQSEKRDTHPWRVEDDDLFTSLRRYYQYVTSAFDRRNINRYIPESIGKCLSYLNRKWDLSQNSGHPLQIDDELSFPTSTIRNPLYVERGQEHQFKTELVAKWSMWIFSDMAVIRSHAALDCYEALRDAASAKAKWELTELDAQLVWGWARRELVLFTLSLLLEDVLGEKMESCAPDRVGQDKQPMMLKSLDFESGRQKRIEQERGAAKKRMQSAMKEASGQAEREGRSWQEDADFSPQWTKAIEFVDKQWAAVVNNQHNGFQEAEDELERMIVASEGGRWGHAARFSFVKQFKRRVSHEHWRFQHELEEQMMKATIERIRIMPAESTGKEMELAYEYPPPDYYATAKFADLKFSTSNGKSCSAIVYDAWDCEEEVVCNVIARSSTRSVINVRPEIVPSIPPNDHLFFLSCKNGKGKEPEFVRRNRDRWWDQQSTNSSTFYFTPERVSDGESCYSDSNTIASDNNLIPIARIFVFLAAPSAVRVSVLHHQALSVVDVSIRENGEVLGIISDVPSSFRLDDFYPIVLQPGRHELELVPQVRNLKRFHTPMNPYHLRDVLIEISDPTPTVSSPSVEKTGLGTLATIEVMDP